MRYFEGSVRTNKLDSDVLFKFVMPDDATEEEIRNMALELMWDCITLEYEEVEK